MTKEQGRFVVVVDSVDPAIAKLFIGEDLEVVTVFGTSEAAAAVLGVCGFRGCILNLSTMEVAERSEEQSDEV